MVHFVYITFRTSYSWNPVIRSSSQLLILATLYILNLILFPKVVQNQIIACQIECVCVCVYKYASDGPWVCRLRLAVPRFCITQCKYGKNYYIISVQQKKKSRGSKTKNVPPLNILGVRSMSYIANIMPFLLSIISIIFYTQYTHIYYVNKIMLLIVWQH